jgi:hypothetical protein
MSPALIVKEYPKIGRISHESRLRLEYDVENNSQNENRAQFEPLVICFWRDNLTGKTGNGSPVPEGVAIPMVKEASIRNPEIIHWLIRVDKESYPG